MRFRLNYLISICLLVFATGSMASQLPKGIIDVKPVKVSGFTVRDIDGKSYTFNTSSTKWRFIHFWATWCGPCRREIPQIEKLVKSPLARKLDIVILNTGESEDTIFEFTAEFAPGLHTYMDADGLITEAWSPRGLPATYLVNPDGEVIYQALGGMPWMEPAYYQFLENLAKQK